jgi:murein L,D-transpeptidase YcbB/YkuD
VAARTQHVSPLRIGFLVLILLAALLALTRPAAQTRPESPVLSGDIRFNERNLLIGGERVDADALGRFYQARNSELAWSGNPKAQSNADIALGALSHAEEQGLNKSKYHLAQLSRRGPHEDASDFDLLLSDAMLRYMGDLHSGRIAASTLYRDVSLPLKSFDAVAALTGALAGGTLETMLTAIAPQHREYARLTVALAKYRKVAAAGEWPQLPKADVKPGTTDPRIESLRVRLMREDAALTADSNEQDVMNALRRYQARNGLEADGKLGPQTLGMLNVTAAERVAQIEANMDRWRWLPAELEPRYIMVNAADATLQVFEKGAVVLRSKVVVGEPEKRTPIFRTLAKEVTVNPPWNVPSSIARKEILPKLKRDPNYLVSQHMILVNGPPDDPQGKHIDWKRLSAANFPYRIRQLPGPDNALGSLKLEMPSAFDIYLHDTPGKTAFARNDRTLSHGCIRVQEILSLASIALDGDAMSAIGELKTLMAAGETTHIALKEPLPVYVVYWTAIADDDGAVQFRKDVYGRDRDLIAALRRENDSFVIATAGCSSEG